MIIYAIVFCSFTKKLRKQEVSSSKRLLVNYAKLLKVLKVLKKV